jgi:hypothetical protein
MITDMVFGVSNVLVAITTLVSAYLQEVADRTCTLAYLSSRLGLVYASESTVWRCWSRPE